MASTFNFVRKEDQDGNFCQQNASFFYQLIWETETEPDSGIFIPVPMLNYTSRMQVRRGPNKPVIVELSTANNRITLDPASGLITLNITNTDTQGLPAGLYQYDLHLISPDGFVTTLIEGKFEIASGITQDV